MVDVYGNTNMTMIDDSSGNWTQIELKDEELSDRNTAGAMFADYIKPEITYVSSDTTINHGVEADDEYVIVEFDVTDKYFNGVTFDNDDIIVNLTDTDTDISSNITKTLEKVDDLYYTVNGVTTHKVGERYKLTIKGLDKGDGETYSGPMSITIPDGMITDKSGNTSLATTTTFQIGVDEPGGSEPGDIVDVVDPIWVIEDIQRNKGETQSASTVTMSLIAKDKYYLSNTLTTENVAEKITVTVDGETPETEYVTRTISSSEYVKQDSNGNYVTSTQAEAIGVRYTLTLSNWAGPDNTFTDAGSSPEEEKKYQKYSGTTKIKVAAGTITDQYTNTSNEQEFDIGHVDFINPIVNEVSSTKGTDTETIVFDVLDKYIDTTDDVEEGEITVYVDGEAAEDITKQITDIREIKEDSVVVGKQYTLVLSDFEGTTTSTAVSPSDGSSITFNEWSGTISIKVAENAVKDKGPSGNSTNGNGNDETKITGNHVDFIKPVIEKVSSNIDTTDPTNSKEIVIFNLIDKYLDTTTTQETREELLKDNISVYVDGQLATIDYTNSTETGMGGVLTKVRDYTYTTTPVDGSSSKTLIVGQQYQLEISNIEGATSTTITSNPADDGSTITFMDGSGTITFEIGENAVIDTSNNTNEEVEFDGDFIDFVSPIVEKKTSNKGTNTETIIFNVIDKYLDTSTTERTEGLITKGEITTDELTIYVDGVEVIVDYTNSSATGLDGTLTPLREYTYTTASGSTLIVAQQYELVLSNFEQLRTATYGSYTEYSGTVSVEVVENAVRDTANEPNAETEIVGDFVDFIKPDVTYIYSIDDTDYENKTFEMVFDIVDKYYDETNSSTLTTSNLATYLEIYVDGEDITTNTEVTKTISSVDVTSTMKKTTTSGVVPTIEGTYNIGKRYTLTLSNLEQVLIDTGEDYLDYSGVITVVVKNNVAKDTTELGNDATTTTMISGVNNPGGSGDGVVVDVVDPLWESEGFTTDIHNQTATITIKGTDKYFYQDTTHDKSKLTANEIEVYVDGTKDTTIIPTIGTATYLQEDRDGDETDETIYAVEYTITLSGFSIDKNQIKIRLLKGALIDQSGNQSKMTEYMVYNALQTAKDESGNWEDAAEDGFLGNANIVRQNIDQVIFVDSLASAPEINNTTCWDVSAIDDKSILAWTTQTSAPYTIYIGSNEKIYANIDSSYLFSYIGSGTACTSTETIKEITQLDTRITTNMSYMFSNCGTKAMTTLQLGTNFDTSNVTNMSNMFANLGQKALTTFDFGSKFDTTSVENMSAMFKGFAQESTGFTALDLGATGVTFNTSSVTNMTSMFEGCGQASMTTFSLGSNFNTTNVQYMSAMFKNFGYKVGTLTLGNSFYTSAVTDMSSMFEGAGQTSMTSLNLGTNFNTTNVTDMSKMFKDCGKTLMTRLDLGDVFYTTSATNMTDMFNGCGNTAMTILDLGPAFTKIASSNTGFITDFGKSEEGVIYAPESIYNDRIHFKLSTDSTTTIEYTRGTINPVYKPECEKVSTSVDVANKEITITFKGYANENFTNGTYTGSYASDITSSITTGNDTSNLLVVKVDGEVAEEITQTVTAVSVNDNEVQYTIKLSGFGETSRQTAKDKNFLEWSGNIAIQPVKGTLIDDYGNKNMVSIDDADGNWTDIELRDVAQEGSADKTVSGNWIDDVATTDVVELREENTAGAMFADYVKPEFTYVYSATNPDIDGDPDNRVTIVFDVTDKYFESTALATDSTGSLITVKVDEDADANTAIRKTLTKVDDLYYTVNGVTTHKVGERYQLVIDGLESSDGVGYSGPLTLTFVAGSKDEDGNLITGIVDKSGNLSDAMTITMGIDEPENPDQDEEIVVDVVNPVWSYADSEIDRTNNVVNIYIIGSDKYYASNSLTKDNITVYVDGSATTVDTDRDGTADANVTNITKTLTDITSEVDETRLAELIAGAGLTGSMTADNNLTAVGVIYKLTLSTFGTISGETKVELPLGTITDESGNVNTKTTIEVGNVTWVEDNEPLEEDDDGYPRYQAFRNDIVDFIKPVITYNYSTVVGEENPEVDYTNKIVTVKFTVTDKYLLESDLIETTTDGDGNTIKIPKNMTIIVDDETIYVNDGDSTTTDTREVTATISSQNIDNGIEYTLVVEGLQKYEQLGNDGYTYSGPMQVVFNANVIDDTSGNKNDSKTITLDTEYDDVVDVVDPIVKITEVNGLNLSSQNANNKINRDSNTDTVEIVIRGEDKYLVAQGHADRQLLVNNADNIIVKVIKHDGTIIENSTQIQKSVTKILDRDEYVHYRVTLSNFGTDQGITSITIPADMIKDTSGNGNIATEVYVGNTDWALDGSGYTAFNNSIVDFTDPTWNYATSSITRDRANETGTVTVKILGHDDYFFRDKLTLTDENIQVYIGSTLAGTEISKSLVEITDTTELTSLAAQAGLTDKIGTRTITDVVVGYTLTLSGFTQSENPVKVVLPANTIRDTSSNGNAETEFLVGNTTWVETDVEPLEEGDTGYPKYTAFRNSIVDYIKPVITQGDVTLDRTLDKVHIKFTVTDTNFLESNIGTEDLTIYIDEMLVYGTGANADTDITAEIEITNNNITDSNGRLIGYEYTLTLSALELSELIGTDIFLRHSGDIKVEIAEGQVEDTSGNKNIKTDLTTYADFVDPIFKYHSKYTNWEGRYALITVRATDRFYDYDESDLQPSDLTLYKKNEAGEWVNITNQFYDPDNEIENISISSVDNGYGEDFIIRLDDFEEEFEMRIDIKAQTIYDTSDNYNKVHNIDYRPIIVALDNRRPYWEYVGTDADITDFDDETTTGTISFYVDGLDKYLDLETIRDSEISLLEAEDIKILLDQEDVTNVDNITVTEISRDDNYSVDGESGETTDADGMRSVSYRIDVTGLASVGTYTLVIAEDTLIDDYDNTSAATTITCSRSAIASNTINNVMVTYHVSPDNENVHHSYVREVMSVNASGTNGTSTTYRPSTLGELNNNGENPLFAEPMYNTVVTGYTVSQVYAPKSFAGWAEADEDGNIISGGTTYGLYDEIPNTVTNLKAVWQTATVVFVSNTNGDDSYDGKLPTTPVKTMTTAFSKLSSSGTAANNIIVVMDEVEWNSTSVIDKAATITSLYAGIDYETSNNAELKISSNMETTKDIAFDDIKLNDEDGEFALVANYANITLGRRVNTTNYTFGLVVGGNYLSETTTGQIGTHTIRVESGKYGYIYAGSVLEDDAATTTAKYVTHEVVIGNMKDTALAVNNKLTITESVLIGESEQKCYPYGSTGDTDAYNKIYSNITLYSGTLSGIIHTRSLNGTTDGIAQFIMYGGEVTGNIYAGSRTTTRFADEKVNIMKFYGGQVTGNIYGQGDNETFTGSSVITLQGIINITGNVYGGAEFDSTSVTGTGDSYITLDSSSATINGNIYGASYGSNISGDTDITIKAGKVKNIYGSGNNGGNIGNTNITIESGAVISENIVGGAYKGQTTGTATISVTGGTITGNIFGGNENTTETELSADTTSNNAAITINGTATINGAIYGGGRFDKVGTTTIQLLSANNVVSAVYGGSDTNSTTTTANITLNGMTIGTIYGGGNQAGIVTNANINLNSGTATDVYGGGYAANVGTSTITLEGTGDITDTIYGGARASATIEGEVTTSNVILKSGNVVDVFGGGNSSNTGKANVTLDGITIDTIHGGSKDAGTTTETNVILTSGTVTDVFGGGLDSIVGTSNVTHNASAVVTTIYGGNDSGTGDGGNVGTSKVNVINSTIANIYGGNYLKGTTTATKINIQGTSSITGELYGGGFKSNIGTDSTPGSTTINITGATIAGDINGGSKQGVVYGTTNINIGKDAVNDTNFTDGNISIAGNIYGGGDAITDSDYSEDNVVGDTKIKMYASETTPITFNKSIYGSGNETNYDNGTTTDGSEIHLKNMGSSTTAHKLISIERTGTLYIGNSNIELLGRSDKYNTYKKTNYSLNRITNGVTVYDNTTIHTQRGFNLVNGFSSYKTISGTGTLAKATVRNGNEVTEINVDNRLYTFEGVNLIFSRDEGPTTSSSNWGEINGMTFFGMYKLDDTGNKVYDVYDPDDPSDSTEGFFANGTYVEGLHETDHVINTDGFYTNIADYDAGTVIATVIQPTPENATYYDWIIGAEKVTYNVSLIGSIFGDEATEELLLDFNYAPNATYTLDRVSLNALDGGVNLINPLDIPIVSANANNTFGLSIEAGTSGWIDKSSTDIYTQKSATDTTEFDNGSFVGDKLYSRDSSTTPGTIKFKMYNSLNITQTDDLGYVNLILTGRTTTSEDGSEGNTFIIVISVNLIAEAAEQIEDYVPSFTDTTETELHYTSDSEVDLSYVLFKNRDTSPYETGDYRVISTTQQLPIGTKLTLKDYGQGNSPVVYYYHVTSLKEAVNGKYDYKLSDFYVMDSTTEKYTDIDTYYHTDGYVLEKYDLSIDYRDSNITTNLTDIETYLELRKSSDNEIKYDNNGKEIKYNLHSTVSYVDEDGNILTRSANAIVTETISNEGQNYSVIENTDISFTLNASIVEQLTADGETIRDTKYYDKIMGIAIEVLDVSEVRVLLPDVQNVKLIDTATGIEYGSDESGVIRIPLTNGIGVVNKNYTLSIAQNSVQAGMGSVNVYLFASDDGQYYGNEEKVTKSFNVLFVSKLLGFVGIEGTEDSRIISLETGKNLQGTTGVDMTVSIGNPIAETNIRIELYKRSATYDSEGNYTGTIYTLIDLADYLGGTWETPASHELTAANSYEYIFWTPPEETTDDGNTTHIELERELTELVTTGEYKILIKSYHSDTLVQTVRKTFIVTE